MVLFKQSRLWYFYAWQDRYYSSRADFGTFMQDRLWYYSNRAGFGIVLIHLGNILLF